MGPTDSTGEGPARNRLQAAIRRAGVRDPRVLAAFEAIDRRMFVPPTETARAGDDEPIPIGHAQVTTQPSLISAMVEALRLVGSERVLEVGTGYGYQTAILASLVREVYSIERVPELADRARTNLERAGIRNAIVVTGDGTRGLPPYAPFAAIIVTAAAPAVPAPLVDQLIEDGRLVQPIGHGGNEQVTVFRKQAGTLVEERQLTAAAFVPLVPGEPE